jgi:hypothetical protein
LVYDSNTRDNRIPTTSLEWRDTVKVDASEINNLFSRHKNVRTLEIVVPRRIGLDVDSDLMSMDVAGGTWNELFDENFKNRIKLTVEDRSW